MALIESMFLPRLVDELARMSSQAGQDYRDGGEARMLQGIDDEHRTNIEKVLLELYEVAGQSGFSYINGLYGKKKGSMAEALARLAEAWFPDAFAMSTLIAETSKEYLRAVTHKLVAEGVHENEMARSIREAGEDVSLSRARTIARTESHAAVMKSQQQVLDDMDLPPYKKVWMAGSDGRVRKSHKKADGQERLPNEPFDVGGDSLMYPAERGGKPENVINCLLPDAKISVCSPTKLYRRRYVGAVIKIKLISGDELSVTPNHPILTNTGWKKAYALTESDKVLVDLGANCVKSVDLDVKTVHAKVGDLFDSLIESGHSPRATTGVMNFHGDVSDSDVEVIDVAGPLVNGVESKGQEVFEDLLLELSETASGCLIGDGALDQFLFASLDPSDGIVGSFSNFLALLGSCIFKPNEIGLRPASDLEAEFFQASVYCDPIHSQSLTHVQDRDLGIIEAFDFIDNQLPLMRLSKGEIKTLGDQINSADGAIEHLGYFERSFPLLKKFFDFYLALQSQKMRFGFQNIGLSLVSHYDGYVYNIEDKKVFYCATTIVNHNCRCVTTEKFIDDE
jgi:hypothetical protein